MSGKRTLKTTTDPISPKKSPPNYSPLEGDDDYGDHEVYDANSDEEYNYVDDMDGNENYDGAYDNYGEEGFIFKILTQKEIWNQQNSDLKKVKDVLEVSEPFARTLLMFFRWDLERLLEIFFSKGKSAVYARAGLIEDSLEPSPETPVPAPSKTFECPVCLEEVKYQDTLALSCGHRMCNDCWQTHVNLEFSEGRAKTLHCMGKNCNTRFNESEIVQFLDNKQIEYYNRNLLESYVEDNSRVKWCPSVPHCGNAIMVSPSQPLQIEIRCSCGHTFCFSCTGVAHSPCTCLMLKVWNRREEEKKEHDKSIASKMSKMNIRECPKCGARVERVSGCNLMTCRCGQYFCWLCGGATGLEHTWDTIAGHECGRYVMKSLDELGFEEEEGKELPEEVASRFEFYSLRYNAHLSSAQLEKNLVPIIKKKIEEKIDQESEFYLNWYSHALEKLSDCRKILTWSYLFCFCLLEPEFKLGKSRKQIQGIKILFENYQQRMESSLERLSKELESPTPVTLSSCKRLMTLTILVDTGCAGMYDSVHEIFKDTDVVVSPYQRTTEGTSTMLVKPVPNLVEEIRKEREQKQRAKKLQEEQERAFANLSEDDILKQVMIQSEKEPKTEGEMMEEALRRSLVEENVEESLLQQVMLESCKQK